MNVQNAEAVHVLRIFVRYKDRNHIETKFGYWNLFEIYDLKYKTCSIFAYIG